MFSTVTICFLLPTENDSIENKGEAKLEMLENIDLPNIKVRFIPARMAFDLYLLERKMNIDSLNL